MIYIIQNQAQLNVFKKITKTLLPKIKKSTKTIELALEYLVVINIDSGIINSIGQIQLPISTKEESVLLFSEKSFSYRYGIKNLEQCILLKFLFPFNDIKKIIFVQ